MRSLQIRWAAVAFATLLVFGAPNTQVFADTPTETKAAPAADGVVATIAGKPITADLFKTLVETRRPAGTQRLDVKRVGELSDEQLTTILNELAVSSMAAERAVAAGMKLDPEQTAMLETMTKRKAGEVLYEKEIGSVINAPTDADITAEYEKIKDQLRIPESYTFRIIYLSSYKVYEVKEGDSLRSIAKDISGDEEAYKGIIADETKTPRWETVEPPKMEGEGDVPPVPPKALTAGEILLVPMSEADLKAVEARGAAIEEKLKGGALFEDLAKSESENEVPGALLTYRPESVDKPYHPAIMEALTTIDVGSASKPLRTRHGFHIVYKESYTPGGTQELADVRDQIERRLKSAQADALMIGWFDSYVEENKDSLVLDKEAIDKSRPENEGALKPDDEDIVLTIGEVKLNRRDYLNGMRRVQLPADKVIFDLEASDVLPVLGHHPVVRGQVYDLRLKHSGVYDTPGIVAYRSNAEAGALGGNYFMDYAQKKAAASEPTEQKMKEYYDTHTELFQVHPTAVVSRISMPLAELDRDPEKAAEREKEFLDAANAAVAGAQSRAQFDEAATRFARLNRSARTATPDEAGSTLLTDLPSEAQETIKATPEKSVSKPVKTATDLTIYWVDSVSKAALPPFETQAANIRARMMDEARMNYRQELHDELLKEADVKIVDFSLLRASTPSNG